jgi:hypothetical protein
MKDNLSNYKQNIHTRSSKYILNKINDLMSTRTQLKYIKYHSAQK